MKKAMYYLLMCLVLSYPIVGSAQTTATNWTPGPEGGDGIPSCKQISAYALDRNKEYREESLKAFFGKPLMEYTKDQFKAIRRQFFMCDKWYFAQGADAWGDARMGFARQKLDTITSIYKYQLSLKQAEATKVSDLALAEERKRKLQSGEVQISTLSDAQLLYAPTGALLDIATSPMLMPDGKYYSGMVMLDGLAENKLIRGKFVFGLVRDPQVAYAFLKMSSKAANHSLAGLRIGQNIAVLGRYVDNVKYHTVVGEEKTAPLIELIFMGEK